mmetsp:Transcript_23573/g.20934  ORF Transcript_23573/g.20934 Transcript_23573/m.20934 type:complete len:285 (+) Transcript_23573:204-1058(+)
MNYLMKGMEHEKYLKPNFSKTLTPLVKYLFHNADFYNIPDTYKLNKPGPFKFHEDLFQSPADRSARNNKTAKKLKLALKSAKRSKNKFPKNREYSSNQKFSQIQDMYTKQSNQNSIDYDMIYSSSVDPKYSSISKSLNANKTLRNNRSIEGDMSTSVKRKMKLRKEYQQYYKTKKPIYLSIKPQDLTQVGRGPLEQTSELISTISRPFIKSREKSANCVNRKLRDTQTSFNKNKERQSDQNLRKRRNIRTARPQSIRKNNMNKKTLVDHNQSDLIAVEDKGYLG